MDKNPRIDYLKRKEYVTFREEENDRSVIIFRADDEWWKIIGKSVLYYRNLIEPRLKLRKKAIVHVDDDYQFKSETGVIFVHDINVWIKRFEDLGHKDIAKKKEDYHVFKLNNKVAPEDYNKMREESTALRSMASKIVSVGVVWPALKADITKLIKAGRAMTKPVDNSAQRTFCDPLMIEVNELMPLLFAASDGHTDPAETLIAMSKKISNIKGYLYNCIEVGIFDDKKQYEFSQSYAEVQEQIEKDLKRELKKKEKVVKNVEAFEEPVPSKQDTGK